MLYKKKAHNIEKQAQRLLEAWKKQNKTKKTSHLPIPGIFIRILDYPDIFVQKPIEEDESDEDYGNMGCQVFQGWIQ